MCDNRKELAMATKAGKHSRNDVRIQPWRDSNAERGDKGYRHHADAIERNSGNAGPIKMSSLLTRPVSRPGAKRYGP
jgi:hypothetical protein